MAHFTIDKKKQQDSAIVVGGSLSGLMTAIALAHEGIKVTVLEKSTEGARSGATLKVEGYSTDGSEIENKLKQLVSNGKSSVQLWSSIESNLRNAAHKDPNISLHYNTRVNSVDQDENSVWAETADGQTFSGDILIGADGHRSMVRKIIAPNHPDAKFAGFVVWMASIDEDSLPKLDVTYPNEQVKIMNKDDGFLFGSLIELENMTNQIGITWYDNTQTDLLYRLGAVQRKFVHHSIQGTDIPEKDLEILIKQANGYWPEPWRTTVVHAINSRKFIGVPIKEYVPVKLMHGRFAIVGDAAHVPSPITTKGFNESLMDAVVLSQCVSQGIQGDKAQDSLKKYEARRLTKMQDMVGSGKSFTKSFGRY